LWVKAQPGSESGNGFSKLHRMDIEYGNREIQDVRLSRRDLFNFVINPLLMADAGGIIAADHQALETTSKMIDMAPMIQFVQAVRMHESDR